MISILVLLIKFLSFACSKRINLINFDAMNLKHRYPLHIIKSILMVPLLLLMMNFKCSFGYSGNINHPEKSFSENFEMFQGTETDIRNYLDSMSHSLYPVEGIYYISDKSYNGYGMVVSSKDNWEKVAIIKDFNSKEREFIEILLDGGDYKKYSIIGEFTSASSGYEFIEKQYSQYKWGKAELFNFTYDPQLNTLNGNIPRALIGQKKRTYLKIYPKDGIFKTGEAHPRGSCFAMSKDGYFGTNNHVIKKTKNIEITLFENKVQHSYKASIVSQDENNDVAILKISDTSFKGFDSIPYKLGDAQSMGERVFTIGYPMTTIMGSNMKYTDGSISSLTGIKDDVRFYQISVPVQPGNSGGPLFTYDGLMIGITTSEINSKKIGIDFQNVNYAIKSSYMINLIKMLPETPEIINVRDSKLTKTDVELINLYQKYIGIVKGERDEN